MDDSRSKRKARLTANNHGDSEDEDGHVAPDPASRNVTTRSSRQGRLKFARPFASRMKEGEHFSISRAYHSISTFRLPASLRFPASMPLPDRLGSKRGTREAKVNDSPVDSGTEMDDTSRVRSILRRSSDFIRRDRGVPSRSASQRYELAPRRYARRYVSPLPSPLRIRIRPQDTVEPEEQPVAKFTKFMELPEELRDAIYGFALYTDQPIRPHLCDQNSFYPTAIKFHDAAQMEHGAVDGLLGVTRASKQLREESLRIFYSVNTFTVIYDTPTYFEHLSHLGRFHMVRNVDFAVEFRGTTEAPNALRYLHQLLEEQKRFEMQHRKPYKPGMHVAKFSTDKHAILASHPQYTLGGLPWLSTFLVLRKLACEFTSTDSNSVYSHKLVISVPSAHIFTEYEALKYFPQICEGLGIQLKFADGAALRCNSSGIRLSWHRKFQKKSTDTESVAKIVDTNKIRQKINAMYPNIDTIPCATRSTYYRRNCVGGGLEWYTFNRL